MRKFHLLAFCFFCSSLLASPPPTAKTPAQSTKPTPPSKTDPAPSKECICTAQQISKVFTHVAKQATPAVVYIKAEGAIDSENYQESQAHTQQFDPFGEEFFNRFFGVPMRKMPKQPIFQGSGFFVSTEGYILTNAHVVKDAGKITVVLHDGREMLAEVIGIDASSDLAVIKVAAKDISFLKLGNSDNIDIGEWVIAIGSPFQLQSTVTVGVISFKGRQNLSITDYDDFIQTDAAINPGNSGGPLINLEGEVIGINTAIVSKSGCHVGIGFAIPSNMAQHVMRQIIDSGHVTRGFLGVGFQSLNQEMAEAFGLDRPEGALIAEVSKGSPAEKAGLKQGDIITHYEGIPVTSIGSLRNTISNTNPGTKVTLTVNRNGKSLTIPVILGSVSFVQKLGMDVEPLTPQLAQKLGFSKNEEGLVITKIKPGSHAAAEGLRPGFLILTINHKKVTTAEDFTKALEETKNGRILILAKNGEVTRFYTLKVE